MRPVRHNLLTSQFSDAGLAHDEKLSSINGDTKP
jgi:hypothetical protein